MAILAWGNAVSPEFRERVLHAAVRLAIDPSWMMAIMAFETGKTFAPDVWNKVNHKYVGLIQFGPDAAADLNTTTEALAAMSAVEQLDYVERYFSRYVGRLKTLSDCYMAVLWPAAIGLPDDSVIFQPGSKAYLQNRGLDIDHDGAVTKGEAAAYVAKVLEEGQAYATAERDPRTDENINLPERTNMATAEGIGSIVSLFNPLVGGLISAFGPVLQGKLAKEINRHTDDPATGVDIANQLSTLLLGQARALTGENTDFQAVTKIVGDPAQADNKAKLEAALSSKLDDLEKAGDKASTWDQAMWAAEIAGKQAVSTIAIEEKKAGLWDMTPTLVYFAAIMASSMVLLITLAIIYQSIWGKDGIDVGLIGLGGPLLMAAIQCWKDVFAYRFDGSKQSTEQSKALLNYAKGAKE